MAKENTSREISKGFYWLLGLVFGIALIFMIIVFGLYFFTFSGELGTQEMFAQFGDFIGGLLNPIFSFLTIVLLIGSLFLQRQELGKVVEELELTRGVHQSTVNMSLYEHLLEDFQKEGSDTKMSALNFKEYLDEKLTLDISHSNIYEIGNFTLFEIISNNGLMDIAKKKGYLASRASATGDNVTASRDFKEKLDLLDASIKTIVEKLTQVRGLGCPKLRASELLGFCEEILEDYYYSKHINKMAKTNLLKYARFNELLAAVEDYPENPIPKGIIST